MSKKSLVVLLAVVLLIGSALILGACGEETKKGPNVTSATETTVSIKEMSFNPHTIIIATGTTVTWVNDDNSNHSLTSKDGWFNSEMMEPQDSFEFEFDKPGTLLQLQSTSRNGRHRCSTAWRRNCSKAFQRH